MFLLRNIIAGFLISVLRAEELVVGAVSVGHHSVKDDAIFILNSSLVKCHEKINVSVASTILNYHLDILKDTNINIPILNRVKTGMIDDSLGKGRVRHEASVRQKNGRFTEVLDCFHCSKALGSETIMNTTPTRMVYDRLTRQQQLSIAVASATDIHPQKDRKGGERDSPILLAIVPSS